MVEFAIVAPLLLLLVFGTIEFGRAYNAQNTLTHAAREGARDYAIHQDAVQAETVARNAITSMDRTKAEVLIGSCDPGQPTSVVITYPFELRVAFFPVSTFTMNAEGVMRCGG